MDQRCPPSTAHLSAAEPRRQRRQGEVRNWPDVGSTTILVPLTPGFCLCLPLPAVGFVPRRKMLAGKYREAVRFSHRRRGYEQSSVVVNQNITGDFVPLLTWFGSCSFSSADDSKPDDEWVETLDNKSMPNTELLHKLPNNPITK